MKKLLLFATLLLILFSFAACSSDDDDDKGEEIIFDESVFIIDDAEGSKVEITFNAKKSWTASINYEGSDKGWLTLNTSSGIAADQQQIIVRGAGNTTSKMRTAEIVIHCGRSTQTVTVKQRVNPDADITANFDPNFAKVLEETGQISDATNIKARDVIEIDYIYINSVEITSLAGIEYFESLTTFSNTDGKMANIDFSKNLKLCYLYITDGILTDIDISKNTELTLVNLTNNKLTNIDVSKNTKLRGLDLGANNLKNIDVSKNTRLGRLLLNYNNLSNIDVSKNTELENLQLGDNKLTNIDVKNNRGLIYLFCDRNLLTNLDISNNQSLEILYCINNPGKGDKFVIKSWFDNNNISLQYLEGSWTWEEKEISVDFQKVK